MILQFTGLHWHYPSLRGVSAASDAAIHERVMRSLNFNHQKLLTHGLLCRLRLLAMMWRHIFSTVPRSVILLIALLLISPIPSYAFTWQDLWYTRDQQGLKALEQQQPQQALEKFQDPKWQAIAAYRAQKYDLAAKIWQQTATTDADSAYNLGNAYLRKNALNHAIAAYENTLTLEPNHLDAQMNLRIAQALLRQQQQEEANAAKQEQTAPTTPSRTKTPTQAPEQQANDQTQGQQQDQQQQLSSSTSDEQQHARSQPEAGADATARSQYPSLDPSTGDTSYTAQDGDPFTSDYPDLETPPQKSIEQAPEPKLAKSELAQGSDQQNQFAQASQEQQQNNTSNIKSTLASEAEDQANNAEQEISQQLLRQVQSDPGELLRRKFLLQRAERQRRHQRD